jgi:hypothetical protein
MLGVACSGWGRGIGRHQRIAGRIRSLVTELGQRADGRRTLIRPGRIHAWVLEGAAGSAGRTESTSVIEPMADLMTISSGPPRTTGDQGDVSLTCQPGPILTSSATRPKTCCAPPSAVTRARSRGSAWPLTGSSCPRRSWRWPASTGSPAGPGSS